MHQACLQVETYTGETVKLPMNPQCWEISDRAREVWRTTELPPGAQFFNIFGTGYDTAYDVTYGAPDTPLEELSEIAGDSPPRRFSWIDGDCTVPICCAVAGAPTRPCRWPAPLLPHRVTRRPWKPRVEDSGLRALRSLRQVPVCRRGQHAGRRAHQCVRNCCGGRCTPMPHACIWVHVSA